MLDFNLMSQMSSSLGNICLCDFILTSTVRCVFATIQETSLISVSSLWGKSVSRRVFNPDILSACSAHDSSRVEAGAGSTCFYFIEGLGRKVIS